jgi:hypothetical protein
MFVEVYWRPAALRPNLDAALFRPGSGSKH